MKLKPLLALIFILFTFSVYSQNKKEQIQILESKIDKFISVKKEDSLKLVKVKENCNLTIDSKTKLIEKLNLDISKQRESANSIIDSLNKITNYLRNQSKIDSNLISSLHKEIENYKSLGLTNCSIADSISIWVDDMFKTVGATSYTLYTKLIEDAVKENYLKMGWDERTTKYNERVEKIQNLLKVRIKFGSELSNRYERLENERKKIWKNEDTIKKFESDCQNSEVTLIKYALFKWIF
jgi:hypothetical protein